MSDPLSSQSSLSQASFDPSVCSIPSWDPSDEEYDPSSVSLLGLSAHSAVARVLVQPRASTLVLMRAPLAPRARAGRVSAPCDAILSEAMR